MDLLPGDEGGVSGPAPDPKTPAHHSDPAEAIREGRGKTDAREKARTDDPLLAARFERYVHDLGIPEPQADILSGDAEVADLFEAGLSAHDNPRGIANWITTEVMRELKDRPIGELKFGGLEIGALVALIDSGEISGTIAKDVFSVMLDSGGDPGEIVRDRGLAQVSDRGSLEPIIDALLASHPAKVEEYRSGKTGLLGFFVGQVMRETRGTANPELAQKLVREKLA